LAEQKVLVPLAQGCEELEAVTIIDILVRGGIKVVTASLDSDKRIVASRGVQLIAEATLEEVMDDPFDMMVLPGGLPGSDLLQKDARVVNKLKMVDDAGGIIAAICAAPKVLVATGFLQNKKATSYPGVIDLTPAEGMQYLEQNVVEDGNVITSRGPGTAMDFALKLVEKLQGPDVRYKVESALLRS